jgi:hypothetical protein
MERKKYAVVEYAVDTDELIEDLFDNYANDGNVDTRFHGFRNTHEEAFELIKKLIASDEGYRKDMKKIWGQDPAEEKRDYCVVIITISVKDSD